jgi:hypothetical protein
LLGAEEEASDPTARRTEWGQKIPSSQRAIDSGTRLLGSTEEEPPDALLGAEEEASGAEEEPPDAFLGTGGGDLAQRRKPRVSQMSQRQWQGRRTWVRHVGIDVRSPRVDRILLML